MLEKLMTGLTDINCVFDTQTVMYLVMVGLVLAAAAG